MDDFSSLAERGSRVAFTYHHNEGKAADLVDALGADVGAWRLELSDADEVLHLVDSLAERAGGVHTVVYAAGPHVPMRHLSTIGADDFGQQVNTDVGGFFNFVSAVLPHLRRAQGNLVAVTTAATWRFAVRDGLSVAPKAARTNTPLGRFGCAGFISGQKLDVDGGYGV
jgi:3-oxoacyl-[acyl-carrier protein] reductase